MLFPPSCLICTYAEGRGGIDARACVCGCVYTPVWARALLTLWFQTFIICSHVRDFKYERVIGALSPAAVIRWARSLPQRAVCSRADLHVWTAINGNQRHCHFQWHCTRCRNTTSSLSIRPYLISSCFRRSLSEPDSPPKIYSSALSAFRDIIQRRRYHSALYSGPRDCLNN